MSDDNFACFKVHIFSDRGLDVEAEKLQIMERMEQVNRWVQDDCVPPVVPSWAKIKINHGGGGGP